MNFASIRLPVLSAAMLAALSACAAISPQPPCGPERLNTDNCPPKGAVYDQVVEQHQALRRWHKPNELGFDPIELGMKRSIPNQAARMRIIGSSYEDAVRSLAAKIWLIDHARYTVDATYYIFKRDLAGYAVLGALCDAVQRGVDVRLMVDSLGSINMTHSEMKALSNCAIDGGFVRNTRGQVTTTKARAQVVVFNATSRVLVNVNRRSHDKLLVVDGAFPELAWSMTGGRNVSLDYYALTPTGQPDLDAYRDLEILVRPGEGVAPVESESIGLLSEYYYSVIFSHNGNKRLTTALAYNAQRQKFRQSLATLRAVPDFARAYNDMPNYLAQTHPGIARLAHELGNLNSTDVVNAFDTNLERNPNSIMALMRRTENRQAVLRIVSPYLFLQRYKRKDGTVYYDGKDTILQWLKDFPGSRIEIVTNSVMTSDNFFAQAMIDMEAAPRLLLDPELKKQWREYQPGESSFTLDTVAMQRWRESVNNPQIKIYQTGRLDSTIFGGDAHYGKLHAKFVLLNQEGGFVGTSNFDYRSILFNNEVGYFFRSEALAADLVAEFELLKSQSYLWGSPEWLAMRRRLAEGGGFKAKLVKRQYGHYQFLHKTGLKWQF